MLSLALALCFPLLQAAEPAAPEPETTAFAGVNVVPMDRERVLEQVNVLVRNGRISAIGPAATTPIPAGALIVDGHGRWLIPGLMDMHAHLFSDYETPDELAEEELFIMLAQGVTVARIVIGTPQHLELQKRQRAGEFLGPELFVASPQFAGRKYGGEHFNGYEVQNAEQARAAVAEAAASGYQFIKLTILITPEVYDAVVEEAARHGLPVIGHVGPQVGLARALAAGQQIEHLDEYMEALLPDDVAPRLGVSDIGIWRPERWKTLDLVDEGRVPQVVRAVVEAGVWNTPTLTFFDLAFASGQSDEEIAARPELRFFPKWKMEDMAEMRRRFWEQPPSPERRARYLELRNLLTKSLHDAGAKLLCGSDTPEAYLLYGCAVHRELQSLVKAGLSSYAALETATRNPAEWLGILREAGTLEVGKRADCVLLQASPLADIRNTAAIAGVMSRGRWLPRDTLDRELDLVEAAFRAADQAQSAAESQPSR